MLTDAEIDRMLDRVESLLLDGKFEHARTVLLNSKDQIPLIHQRFRDLLCRVDVSEKTEQNSPDSIGSADKINEGRRKIEASRLIGALVDGIQKARETGDYQTAVDLCKEWLRIEPDSERANEILGLMVTLLDSERESLLTLNQTKELIAQNQIKKALELLETFHFEETHLSMVAELTEEAKKKLVESKFDQKNQDDIEYILRYLDNDQPEIAMARFRSSGNQNTSEMKILKRKIDAAIEIQATEVTFLQRLCDAIDRCDIESARVWLGMICELNPKTDVFDTLRKKLDPELYENLTSRMTIS
jgi:hypothetical protein